jgi:hypothetical protein
LFHPVNDEEGFATDLLRLTDSAERMGWSEKSVDNATRFSADRMIDEYVAIYRQLGAKV